MGYEERKAAFRRDYKPELTEEQKTVLLRLYHDIYKPCVGCQEECGQCESEALD